MKLSIGPGAIVAAAFIGPGTVTACTLAGARFGFALVWTLVFATLAAIVLQDMAARLGAHARKGLGEALLETLSRPLARAFAIGLVLVALGVGNAAYESGNIAGGVLGLEAIILSNHRWAMIGLIAAIAAGTLWIGRYKTLERVLVGLVAVLALSFVAAALLVQPDLGALAEGLRPSVPAGGELIALALIGTTIVPYNLFLHAAAARRHWEAGEPLGAVRVDSAASIALGGLVSILILTVAATSLFAAGIEVFDARGMALALEPSFGPAARYLIGVGLFAAGLTSAITAPMATAYAVNELFPPPDAKARLRRFRIIALGIVFIGAAIAFASVDALALIIAAQAANGLLLPITAVVLLVVMNRKRVMGAKTNALWVNALGGLVVLLTFGLGLRALWSAFSRAFGT